MPDAEAREVPVLRRAAVVVFVGVVLLAAVRGDAASVSAAAAIAGVDESHL
ncbi:hypothetical protein ACTU3I_05855 [Microbacterium sp. RD1]|uniref:hypothetical protein n=1 Tax=Microbacterium sp. RD1 TaxID=3457313 RepID=UPI003FA5C5E5